MRIGRTRRLSLDMFRALCGEDAFPNVAVLTSMWSTDASSTEFARQAAREEQLKDKYLTDILGAGGLVMRLKSKDSATIDTASTQHVFHALLAAWKDDKITLRIQHELVNDRVLLHATAAGTVLSAHLDVSRQTVEAEITKLHATIQDARAGGGSDPARVLQEQQSAVRQHHRQLRADQEAMNVSFLQVHDEEMRRLTAQLVAVTAGWRQELAARERAQALREQVLAEVRAAALHGEATIADLRWQQQEMTLRHREKDTLQTQQLAVFTREQQRRQAWEVRYHAQLVQQGQWREDAYRSELERTRKEMQLMRDDLAKRLTTAEKAKRAWVGPLLQGVASGGLGLAGTLITAAIHDIFTANAKRFPDRECVVETKSSQSKERSFTYRQINESSNRLAHHLLAHGCQTGAVAMIYAYRSADLVVAYM
ncbi:large subunit of alpha-aminoadipate reductase [Sporothrix stenoceras]|uniref:Large subunit of alpha-aminoadipate reductase n=1 Tax=Sporothrix stenoceras TaxID=5173 RepID=A0ABR3YZA1_9PEZI